MSFDWTQYYQLSRELLGKPNSSASEEAKQRSAISRAYYAVFNLAADYIVAVEGDDALPRTKDVHYAVSDYFRRESDKVSRDIADHLYNLRSARNQSDYKTSISSLRQLADSSLMRANSAIQLLSKLKR